MGPFGAGKTFVIHFNTLDEDGNIILPPGIKQLFNAGFHYSGAQKIWDHTGAFLSTDDQPDQFLIGIRLENSKGNMIDLDIYNNLCYVHVQDCVFDRIATQVLYQWYAYTFEGLEDD